jgi:hypothetical protein
LRSLGAPSGFSISALMSSTRHAEIRGPSFTGRGYRPVLIPAHHVDLPTGIGPFGARIAESRTKPVCGRGAKSTPNAESFMEVAGVVDLAGEIMRPPCISCPQMANLRFADTKNRRMQESASALIIGCRSLMMRQRRQISPRRSRRGRPFSASLSTGAQPQRGHLCLVNGG